MHSMEATLAMENGLPFNAFEASDASYSVGRDYTILEKAVGNGLTLTLVIFIIANISGAHVNPAVSFLLPRKDSACCIPSRTLCSHEKLLAS